MIYKKAKSGGTGVMLKYGSDHVNIYDKKINNYGVSPTFPTKHTLSKNWVY